MPTRPTHHQRQFARYLRANQTDSEPHLWQKLRARQIAGFKFRRQYPFAPYILDFYCVEQSLAIELDGGQHYDPQHIAHDQRRTHYLNQQGIRVLRFSNLEVLAQMDAVLEQVLRAVTPHPAPAG